MTEKDEHAPYVVIRTCTRKGEFGPTWSRRWPTSSTSATFRRTTSRRKTNLAMRAITCNPNLIAELIDRARHAKPWCKKGNAREWPGFVAMALLEDHGISVNDSRTGSYVELLATLIQVAGVDYDARRIAQETRSNTLA